MLAFGIVEIAPVLAAVSRRVVVVVDGKETRGFSAE